MDYDEVMHNISNLADMIVETQHEKRKEHLVNRLGKLIAEHYLGHEHATDARVLTEIKAAIEEAEDRASFS